jgi:ABC-type branched-subunit amino acid transport system substrate-binding protein
MAATWPRHWIAGCLAVALLATGCGRDEDTTDASDANGATTSSGLDSSGGAGAEGLDAGAFGDLGVLCQPAQDGQQPAASGDPGLSSDSIQVSTFSDPGFSGRLGLNQELFDVAEAFTAWCNAHGGINGHEVVLKERDAKLFEFQQRVIEACDEGDFFSVGGGAAFDDTGQADRLGCALPVIAGYAVTAVASGADLSIQPVPNPSNELSVGSHRFLAEQFPDSTQHVGIFAGQVEATLSTAARHKEAIVDGLGWKVVYEGTYNPLGETSWRPFLEAMRGAGVRGLIFVGEPQTFATLMTEANSLGVDFDWVEGDANLYDPGFTDNAGTAGDGAYVRTAFHPFLTDEDGEANAAVAQYRELMERYDPGGKIAYLGLQGLSAWLLFAKAANECGADLSRDCVWEKASQVTEWTGGGLHAPSDLTDGGHASPCWSLVVVEDGAFRVADIEPTDDVFVCDEESVLILEGDYGTGARCPNPAYASDPKPSNCA